MRAALRPLHCSELALLPFQFSLHWRLMWRVFVASAVCFCTWRLLFACAFASFPFYSQHTAAACSTTPGTFHLPQSAPISIHPSPILRVERRQKLLVACLLFLEFPIPNSACCLRAFKTGMFFSADDALSAAFLLLSTAVCRFSALLYSIFSVTIRTHVIKHNYVKPKCEQDSASPKVSARTAPSHAPAGGGSRVGNRVFNFDDEDEDEDDTLGRKALPVREERGCKGQSDRGDAVRVKPSMNLCRRYVPVRQSNRLI